MKKIIFLIGLFIQCIIIGFSQPPNTDLVDWVNDVDTQYKVKITYSVNGTPYSLPGGYALLGGLSSGTISVPYNDAEIKEIFIKIADCVGDWIELSAYGTSQGGIDDCHMCDPWGAMYDWDGITLPGDLYFYCR